MHLQYALINAGICLNNIFSKKKHTSCPHKLHFHGYQQEKGNIFNHRAGSKLNVVPTIF